MFLVAFSMEEMDSCIGIISSSMHAWLSTNGQTSLLKYISINMSFNFVSGKHSKLCSEGRGGKG